MKIIFSVMVVVVMGLLAGCKEEVKTKEWYKSHPTELAEVYKKCQQTGEDSDNCRNVREADNEIKRLNAPIPTFNSNKDAD